MALCIFRSLFVWSLCFFLFPGCHAFQTRPQSSPDHLWRLVARPKREFSGRICKKCRKFLHKQLKEISPKVRQWSKVNVPLLPNIPQQLPWSLKMFPKSNGYVPLFPKPISLNLKIVSWLRNETFLSLNFTWFSIIIWKFDNKTFDKLAKIRKHPAQNQNIASLTSSSLECRTEH